MSEKEEINDNKETIKNLKVNKSCGDLFINDFQYPFLNRKDLMSLSTINNNDFPIRKFKQMITNRDWSLNLYNLDIEGSSPRKFGLFSNKFDFTNKNSDIDKSYPYIPKVLQKPNYNLSNEDIEGSKPNCSKCNQLTRHTNPLEPKYNLPKGKEIKIEDSPKFIRDNMYIDDIIGAKSKQQNIFLRNTLNKDDLKDSFPKKQYFTRKDKYNNLDYNDISKIKEKSKRNINPLNPVYNWKYPINNLRYNVGPIERNTSNPFSQYKYPNPYNLRNDDIEGAGPGSKNIYKKFKGSNSCLNIRDIQGAIHGSLIKGITTKRFINPICPKYKYPGEDELKNETNIKNGKNILIKKNENIINNNNKIENNNSVEPINNNKKLEISNEAYLNINENNKENDNNKNSNDIKIIEENEKNKNKENININKNDEKEKIYKELSDLNEYSPNDNEIKFDKKLYKKPEIYYAYKHDKYVIPHIKDGGTTNIHKVKPFQEVINERIRFTSQLNHPKINIISKNPKKSYENKMDDFFVQSTLNNFKLQQRLKNNLNAYYDIGFPEELKTSYLDPKF